MKRNPLKTLRNRADKVFQIYITGKYPKCEICGKPVNCGHHFFCKGSSSALRYVEENMIPVCVGCHLKYHSRHSVGMNGDTIIRRGQKWYKDLMKKKLVYQRLNQGYYTEIIEKYQ